MQINQQVKLIVAEPWNFTSPEGDNKFSGVVCEYTNSNSGEAYLIKNNVPFVHNGAKVSYVVAMYRNKDVSDKNMNIAYIPDNLTHQFNQFDTIFDKLQFVIIGSIV
ncbi:hypothetical protein [Candidatus Formimonas warabiya]|uniref:Uncharacterized protein n=1 Tax=Formimonas warabiya TaxID=1761012 RepID=A0A3G1KS49_FORW1|nr:hypothetical protein [Candidatus Formimonas warabiya]ATW25276.1 hypothetical protein DCMF_11310 [Candidatus Formimonas warabiya]